MFPWQEFAESEQQNQIALRDHSQGVIFTWAELNQKITEYAQRLKQHRIKLCGTVAIKGKNNLDYLLYYLAGLARGANVLGINPAMPIEKCIPVCTKNRVELLIDVSSNETKFIPFTDGELVRIPMFSLEEIAKPNPVLEALKRAQTYTLTSGTTDLPKTVAHNLKQHYENALGVCELMDFQKNNSWLLSLPLYHVSGQGIVWRWLAQGAELHLPSQDFYADALQVSHISLVPAQAQRLLDFIQQHSQKLPQKHPESAVKIQGILLGGAHIPTELMEKFTALGIDCYVGYGMTEMASTVFAKKYDGKEGVGKPLLGREFKLVNGEIWLRGAGLANGYFEHGGVHLFTNADDWFMTKDLGVWDGENLQILGRADNMFISGGENIQPEEIEKLLLQHESVKQVFVLPKDDTEFGQRPVALVEFHFEFSQSAVEILQNWLSDKIEKFKQPVAYFPLPTSEQGNIKISRQQLKQQLSQYLS